ncbi:MAG: glycosyltransferase family 9 protein [Xanthomonadaceae bacterium]|nr:glycosyltransferase family 9 protein [Xanthomonadaceae bacterium]
MAASSNLKSPRRALVLRLSSLGDIVLTTSALEVLNSQYDEVHYLTEAQYAPWLKGHPGIVRVWEYSKSSGFNGWQNIGRELAAIEWDAVYDLHLSLRTRIARRIWGLKTNHWVSLPKPYFRRLGLFSLKKFWPKSLSPASYRELFAVTCGGSGREKTSLKHLLSQPVPATRFAIGVMPSSRWSGKEPPVELIVKWLKENHSGKTILVFGSDKDLKSHQLVKALEKTKIPVVSKIGVAMNDLISSIATCERVAGADTGLIHVAESIGIPVHVWYGPTAPGLGFAPSLETSTYSQSSVVCSPCSKDGRHCQRVWQSYQCWVERL